MRNRALADLDRVVALGGGHGLGRVMSSLAFLGSRLTGIVTTTDNGGSTGRIRRSEGGIAWGDMRNCLNQLITEPSVVSAGQADFFCSHTGKSTGDTTNFIEIKKAFIGYTMRFIAVGQTVRATKVADICYRQTQVIKPACERIGKLIHGLHLSKYGRCRHFFLHPGGV